MSPGVVERLLSFRDAMADTPQPATTATPVALGWSTVDLDRAIGELGEALGLGAERFAVAPDEQLLGARCLVATAALPDGSSLAVLEPSTEGRLAATLARVGEGPAVIWWAAADGYAARADAPRAEAGVAPLVTSTEREDPFGLKREDPFGLERPGPFGLERLVLGGPPHGPHRLVVRPPGTIRA
jgi:hypothetical protein